MKLSKRAIVFILAVISMAAPINSKVTPVSATPPVLPGAALQPNIGVSSYYSMDKAQRGRTIKASVVMDIPNGYHVNSNRPSEKYLIATSVKLDPRDAVKVSNVTYPRAILRSFSFSNQKLSVFEGRAVMRFNVTIPAGFPHSKMELKARVRFQSCSDKECYAPATRDVSLWIDVVNPDEATKRANGKIFGGK